ncbi:MAG: arsenate reductase ArsC [Deltaproteobacteria bacterium]|nr:arsenate reductase ArsC [Deltaproteobacteria bacterium]
MDNRLKILFLCTGNSCRSQMAEAWTNTLKGDQFKAFSAGVEPKKIDLRAVRAMAESGIDISMQQAKDMNAFGDSEFDYVVTLCDNAKDSCPFFPARIKLLHRSFDDPPSLAEGITDDQKAMAYYRRVRDEIRSFVEKMPEVLAEE